MKKHSFIKRTVCIILIIGCIITGSCSYYGGLETGKCVNVNEFEKYAATVEDIIATSTGNDFVTFEIKNIVPIVVAKKYAGIGASLVARIKNTKTPFSIDFGVGDVIIPNQEKRRIPTQLEDFEAPLVNTYSLETTIAEKLMRFSALWNFTVA